MQVRGTCLLRCAAPSHCQSFCRSLLLPEVPADPSPLPEVSKSYSQLLEAPGGPFLLSEDPGGPSLMPKVLRDHSPLPEDTPSPHTHFLRSL